MRPARGAPACRSAREVAVRLYELKVWPLDQEGVWRAIDVTDRQSLHNLHETIKVEFGLAGQHLYCFYLGDKAYDAKKDYRGPGADLGFHAKKNDFACLGL